MKIAVLGGDGFCGWPCALHLASQGHAITVIDNLSRRALGDSLGAPSLTPIKSIHERIKAAKEIGDIVFEYCDIARDYEGFKATLNSINADTVIHFAEQRSAPYSMLGSTERRYTVDNNVNGTNNLMSALVELGQSPHVVHLGTMGVYGYSAELGRIPEGYLDVSIPQTKRNVSIPYPANPGSIYHLTKVLDHQLMQFYAKNWNFRITDLHQGIVWGTETELTMSSPALMNRFDYDGEYGTVLNRMICQAQIGFPLTVYGSGQQSRAFINISDTARCVAIAAENPPQSGDRVRVFNQVAEVHTISDIAKMISDKTGVEIGYLENPRKEAAKNDLDVCNAGLRSLGFDPIMLDSSILNEIEMTVNRYSDRLNPDAILSNARW